ncbi:MAG: serine/threonine-protein kinase [Polyangiaceae bacterium]
MSEERPAARILAPGTRIGTKYVLVRRLATGGMGEVWLAQNETTQASVALKVLRPNTAEKALEAEERFRREARLAGLLTHRSIVRIFDFLEEPDGTLVLVMELLQGETLEQWLARRGARTEREAMAVMNAVLSALQHGHEQGVVHRDVKPSNIFLAVESDGKVIPKLLDYGIAKMPKNDSKTMDGVVLGTPSYMSPEQIRSEDDLDGRSDLFSCGVVLYETLTGACPFDAPTPSAAIAAVLQTSVDPDPRISPLLWLELQRALSKRPKQRHASAAEMRSAMLAALGETEDSLAPVLQGVKARDYGVDRTGPVAALSVREAETQSVEGQSVATIVPPRKRAAWWPWAAAGTVVGSAAMVLVMTRPSPPAPTTTRPTSATSVPAALGAPSLQTPAPSEVASIAPPPPAATAPASTPVTAPHTTPALQRPPHHAVPKIHPTKPVATSPGF